MKTKTCSIAVLFLAGLVSSPAEQNWTKKADFRAGNESCLPAADGLVSWWGGDEDAGDLQGENAGILRNGVTYGRGFVSRAAFSFDGNPNGTVQVGSTATLKMTTAVTLEGWIYPTALQGVFVNREGEYEFGFGGNGGVLSWAFANTDPGWIWVSTGFVPPLGTWTHVAVTYDSGLITTYANGVQVHQYQGSGIIGDVFPDLNDFRIGNRQQFTQPFSGSLDEFKVYNRALSSDEIAAIHASGSGGNCKSDVFVQDISPYAVPQNGGNYKIGTTTTIVDTQAHAIAGGIVWLKVTLPDGGFFSQRVTTDSSGIADYSLFSSTPGTYAFKIQKVRKIGRAYSRESNVETSDEINIP